MHSLIITNKALIGLNTHSKGEKSCLELKIRKKSRLSEGMYFGGEPTTILLLKPELSLIELEVYDLIITDKYSPHSSFRKFSLHQRLLQKL